MLKALQLDGSWGLGSVRANSAGFREQVCHVELRLSDLFAIGYRLPTNSGIKGPFELGGRAKFL